MATQVSAAGETPVQTADLNETTVVTPAPAEPGPDIDEVVDKVVNQVRKTFGNRFTSGNVATLISEAMEACETFRVASGPKKKSIVIAAIEKIAEESIDDDTLRAATTLLVPSIIDSLISAYKKQIDLGTEPVVQIARKCRWLCC